ncbi:MAG TPA: AmmeMemoRadiSam system protein B [archaeon]|nr:AmmeMemoRadiSam system protein B [archaeon]
MSNPADSNPVLRRDIDIMPVQGEDGSAMIVMRDPLELYGKGPVALRAETLGILAMLDGHHSLEDIRMRLVEQTARAGRLTSIPKEVIQGFLDQLNEVYLLDNERYHSARLKLVENFAALDSRPAALAGKSYPREKAALVEYIDELLAPGIEETRHSELKNKQIVALVSPHIDLQAGARLYAASYNLIKGHSYDRVVILGVGHNLESGLFCFTDKNFSTPLGTVPTDRLTVTRLKKAAGPMAADNDFAHRGEHSIEFQLIFLQRVLEGPFSIVPVLCGSLYEQLILGDKKRPREIAGLGAALDYLAGLLEDPASRTLLLAGVDFSHVGPKFGDRSSAMSITAESTRHDKTLLEALTSLDVDAFCAAGRGVRDRYHVCGFTVLSLLLEVLPEGVKGVELGHRVWHEEQSRSAVSFASCVYYRD